MFRTNRENVPFRLPKLNRMPSEEDFNTVLHQSQTMRGRVVELHWNDGSGDFILTLVFQNDADPVWTLYKTRMIEKNVLLQHLTSDFGLFHKICLAACTGESPDEAILRFNGELGLEAIGLTIRKTFGDNEEAHHVTGASTFSGLKSVGDPILEGDLVNMPISNLMQSIGMSKMTGRLRVDGSDGRASIFFVDGVPYHVLGPDAEGESGMLEILTWTVGKFRFHPNERSAEKTIEKRLDSMLMQGVALLDQKEYLNKHGAKVESYLIRRNPYITEHEFEQTLLRGAPLDMALQKRFYQQIGSKSTLFDVLRLIPLPKVDWIPIMFNLISCELVGVSDTPPHSAQVGTLQGIPIDTIAVQKAVSPLYRPETGLLSYPALLFFMEQEIDRFNWYSVPFSFLVISIAVRNGQQFDPAPSSIVKEIFERLSPIIRKIDVVGHFQLLDYAMLLSFTDSAAAGVMGKKFVETAAATFRDKGFDPNDTGIAVGIASVPEDSTEPGMLIAAANEAKLRSKQTGSQIISFQSLHM
jgi:Domain of unknown function (DUF4388)